jgi:integrase
MKANASKKSPKAGQFPLTVTENGISVKIYKSKSKNYVTFMVVYFVLGKRKMRGFSDPGDAIEHAKQVCRDISNGDQLALELKNGDRMTYLRAVEALAPVNVSLDTAAKEYADAVGLLAGRASIMEAARDWLKRNAMSLPKISVKDAVEALEKQAEADRKSPDRQKQLKNVLDRFADNFNVPVHTITPKQVSDYLSALPLAERSRRNHRDVLGYFSRWLVLKGYLPKGADLLDGVQNYSCRKVGEISTYSPDEMGRLIAAADDRILPFIVIAGFAGLRHAEISRLDWQDIDLAEKFIEVKAEHSKVGIRRIVLIKDNLAAWLCKIAKRSGKVVTVANITKQLLKTAANTGNKEREIKPLVWKHNALRHTYISARVAECGDVPRVADEAGNSVAVIRSNYLKRIRPAQAQAWFEIAPANQDNIVELKTARA